MASAPEEQNELSLISQGETKTYLSTDTPNGQSASVGGGWWIKSETDVTEQLSSINTNVTLQSGLYEEMIANSFIGDDENQQLTFNRPIQLGNSLLTIGTEAVLKRMTYNDDVVSGGSKMVNSAATVIAKKTSLVINGYRYDKTPEDVDHDSDDNISPENRLILGGNIAEIIHKQNMIDQEFTSIMSTEETSLIINGGEIPDSIVVGSVASNYIEFPHTLAKAEVIDKNTNLVINGGTFGESIYASGATGQNTKSTVENVNITINDGVFDESEAIFGGAYVEQSGQALVKNSTITVNQGEIKGSLVAGGHADVDSDDMTRCNGDCQEEIYNDITIPSEREYKDARTHLASQDSSKSVVENAVINMKGGKVGAILLGGVNKFSVSKVPVKQATLNYYGGQILRTKISVEEDVVKSGIDAIAERSIINLYNDLTSDIVADAQSIATISGNRHTITGSLASIDRSILNGSDLTLDGDIYAGGETAAPIVSLNNVMFKSGKEHSIQVGGKTTNDQLGIINISNDKVSTLTGMTFRGVANGQINLNKGDFSGLLKIDGDSNVNLVGASYTSQDLANDLTITAGKNGKLVLKDNGVLKTLAGQIFNDGDATKAENLDTLAVKEDIKGKISFVGGIVKLDDAKYSINYVKQAKTVFNNLAGDTHSSVVMTGELVDKNLSVNDMAELGKDVALDKVTVTTSSANLIVGSNESTDSEVRAINASAEKVSSGFNVGKLDLQTGSEVVSINQNNEVTLGGTEGGEVLLVSNQTNPNLNVVVGSSDKDAGILNLGNDQVTAATQLALTTNVIVKNHSQLNTRGTTTINGNVSLSDSTLDTQDGTLTLSLGKTLEVKGNSSLTGTIKADKLAAASASDVVNIGTSSKAGKVSIKQADLAGATLFLDPQWLSGQTISDGTSFTTNSLNNTKVVVGNNSVFVYGTDATTAYNAFNNSGLSWGNGAILSAAYLAGSLDLANNSLVVDPLATASSGVSYGALSIGNNALLMVDGRKVSGSQAVALTNVVTANVGADAKLYLDNVSDGETYNIMSGTDVETNNSWYVAANADANANGNVLTYQSLYKLIGAANNNANSFGLTAKLQSASAVYGSNGLLIQNVVNNTLANHSGTSAKAFFDKAMNSLVNTTLSAQIDAFNSAAAMSPLGNVTYGAYKAAELMNETLTNHLSTLEDTEYSKNVWVRYIHTKDDISGLNGVVRENGNARHHGLVLGLDLYREAGNAVGLAFTHINSKYKNSTLATETTNKAKYFGFSAYGRANIAGLAVLADASYVKGDNDLTQYNSGYRLMGTQDTAVISVGTTVEKTWKVADSHTLIPYVGVRYLNLDSGNYTNSVGLSYSQDKQNLFVLPVGVKYQATLRAGEWKVNPSLELGYAWNIGNRQAKQTVRYANVADSFTYNVVDKGNFVGKVGIEAKRGNFVYSLGYEYQKGSSVKSNRYIANLSYLF
ncbi:hypothetical protein QV06_02010 [Gallibacterium genomosp. 3]|uniref:Autotransporter domain-containing protein n=1 Tax=Gallibacterium genomosp. 3 TaxID=505345 RepID=A0A1A7PUM0_9PAST|nr:autotransporter outer membrane beta-barrel domain-containing protein [Gallibacterium genomosp. 3]OBX05421.1 hypothetical protein QV06_02010 [Gallibacterium genomosp. 3]